jgi:hypothetical protein
MKNFRKPEDSGQGADLDMTAAAADERLEKKIE